MSTRLLAVIAVCGLLLAAGVNSCNIEAPERAVRDPLIQGFTPNTQTFDVVVGQVVDFSIRAMEPDNDPLSFYYMVADSIVSTGPDLSYTVPDTGLVEVRGVVTNRSAESSIHWQLRAAPYVNLPPVVIDFDPPDPRPIVIVGEVIQFSMTAQDPEGEALNYIFTLDDSLVAASNRYAFLSSQVGAVAVKSTAFDPDSSFVTQQWDLRVAAEPDSILPATVNILSLGRGLEPGELIVEWTAVGDDSMDGLASEYLVGTSSTAINSEHTWNAASERQGAPPPATPGTIQTMVIRDLKPANLVWVAVRAQDDFGNLSPLGTSFGKVTKGMEVFGTLRDAVTGMPVSDILVELAGLKDTTGTDGGFALTELPGGISQFRLTDETVPGVFGAYFNTQTDPWFVQHDFYFDYWLLPNVTLQTTAYSSFLEYFRAMLQIGGALGEKLRTWDYPVDVYVKPFVKNGVDYEQKMRESFDTWEQLIGLDMFTFVNSVPALGIEVVYRSDIDRDFYQLVTLDGEFKPIQGRINMRTIYDTTLVDLLTTISMHEIGHSLGLGHSNDMGHLMVGGITARVMEPTLDEIWLARAVVRIPRGTPIGWYRFE